MKNTILVSPKEPSKIRTKQEFFLAVMGLQVSVRLQLSRNMAQKILIKSEKDTSAYLLVISQARQHTWDEK